MIETIENHVIMMKRRQLIRYSGASCLAAIATGIGSRFQPSSAQTPDVLSVQWLGHTCFLFTGSGRRVLVNPFRTIGCTQGYRSPQVQADFVFISSRLLDEGASENLPGNPQLIYQAALYDFLGNQLSGITTDKDREGGRSLGQNVAWLWTQAGIKILHLGALASPISLEKKILMGTPDLLFLPVGGGKKSYTPDEAKKALATINPKIVIPTHYRTPAADHECDLSPLEDFLTLMKDLPIQRSESDTIKISSNSLPAKGPIIQVLNYK